jgi:hypothetical protein
MIRPKLSMRALILAALAAVPVLVIAVLSALQIMSRLADPCIQWGAGHSQTSSAGEYRSGQFSAELSGRSGHSTANPCAARMEATSETRSRALGRLVTIPCGLLVASLLGVFGALRSRPSLAVAGSIIMFLESAVMFSIFPLTLAAALLLLLAARQSSLATRPSAIW